MAVTSGSSKARSARRCASPFPTARWNSPPTAAPARRRERHRKTQLFQAERVTPLAAHIVVGHRRLTSGAGKNVGAGLDRSFLVAGREAFLPRLQPLELGAIRA